MAESFDLLAEKPGKRKHRNALMKTCPTISRGWPRKCYT